MVVCMFTRIDDEIMRCKNRLVFLTGYEVKGTSREYPKLKWNSETHEAILGSERYDYICNNDGSALTTAETNIISSEKPDSYLSLPYSQTKGNQILISFNYRTGEGYKTFTCILYQRKLQSSQEVELTEGIIDKDTFQSLRGVWVLEKNNKPLASNVDYLFHVHIVKKDETDTLKISTGRNGITRYSTWYITEYKDGHFIFSIAGEESRTPENKTSLSVQFSHSKSGSNEVENFRKIKMTVKSHDTLNNLNVDCEFILSLMENWDPKFRLVK